MDNDELTIMHPDAVQLWFHDGLYGKIQATAFNNYIGAFAPGEWYAMHYLPNASFWLYRLDGVTDEQTARIHSGTIIREGDYPVVKAEVFTCSSVISPNQTIVHHAPTDVTRPVLFEVEGTLGPIRVKYVH